MFGKAVSGWARRLRGPRHRIAADIVRRAEALRDARQYGEAAILFEEAARLRPDRAGIHVQCGHMFKETGQLDRAERHYRIAERLTPQDADLALQLGHFYKVAGRLDEAAAAYRRAVELDPHNAGAATEAARMEELGAAPATAAPEPLRFDREIADIGEGEALGRLAPGLVPRDPQDLLKSHDEVVDVRRRRRPAARDRGVRRPRRGVEAIRGFVVSATPIVELQVILQGATIHRAPLKGGYLMTFEADKERVKKYVFNEWLDFSAFRPGLRALELRFLDADGAARSFHEQVVIAAPVAEADYPKSDALVELAPGDERPIEEQIRARPSMVRSAVRALFPDGIRNVLVLRTDQLGDMVASIPAITRLRELAPEANIVGLLTVANVDLARTLNLFDEIILADFPDDKFERRRLMPLGTQEELRRRLEPYRFDIALDLAQSNVSRDLLQLSGARFIYGMGGEDWPWLSADFILNTHDRRSGMDVIPHSAKVLAMVEALGALLRTSAPIARRDDLSPELLEPYGIRPGDRFVVLHAGARVVFSRWPHYPALAAMLLREPGLKVVMMTEDPQVRATLPPELLAAERFTFLDERLPFDHFDAFMSFCTVMVGNDSGPKHLASLRGTNVVTLFTARIDWAEWGQENVGTIISRRVPCAGCAIFHDIEECGKEFACIVDIRPQEVFDAVMAHV